MTKIIYIFWTCQTKKEAKEIVHGLLDQRLIACASLLPEVESIYRWKDKIEEAQEVKVILKTIPQHFEAIRLYILQHGSYETPEILQVPIEASNPDYLSWVLEETKK